MATATAKKKSDVEPEVKQYRLMMGQHSESVRDENGELVQPRRNKIYKPGDIIRTTTDLLRMNGPGPQGVKFVLVGSTEEQMSPEFHAMNAAQAQGFNDGMDDMSLDELRKLAREEDIDLSGLSKKEEIARAIRAAYGE